MYLCNGVMNYLEEILLDENKATEALLKEYKHYFLNYIGHHFQNIDRDEAYSIYIDTITEVWEQVKRGKLTADNLTAGMGTYIVAIGKIKAKHFLKEQNRTLTFTQMEASGNDEYDQPLIDTICATAPDFGNDADRLIIRSLFDRISEKCRRLLHLFYVVGASMEAIALELGLKNANAAKTQKLRCITSFKNLYSNYIDP